MTNTDKEPQNGLRDTLNFILTNRFPRVALSRFMGWFSKIEQPLVRDASIAIWRLFCDVDMRDAKLHRYASLHDCFIRELVPGARAPDPSPDVIASPCDCIVGAHGSLRGVEALQAKGMPYSLMDLLGDAALVEHYRDGCYATLRITAGMYHRFHAPHDMNIDHVTYFSGDAWNVNPPALARVPGLFCKNERAVIRARLAANGDLLTLVPVAAVLVASIRLHFANVLLHLEYAGPNEIPCKASARKGEELGWFQHGSTIIVFAPRGYRLAPGVETGIRLRAGAPLMRLPAPA